MQKLRLKPNLAVSVYSFGIPLGDAGNIKQVNPDDIESIEVLRDASSASIYGSRRANGVILITTRRGKTGQARISINALTTVSSLANKLDVFHDPVDVATLSNESRLNGGDAIGAWDVVRRAITGLPQVEGALRQGRTGYGGLSRRQMPRVC